MSIGQYQPLINRLMAIKKAKNRAMTGDEGGVKQKSYTFPGNPPVTVQASSTKEALEKYQKLSVNNKQND